MKFEASVMLLAMMGEVTARPDAVERGLATPGRLLPRAGRFQKHRREVPQEHSHEKILTSVRTSLNLNNVDQVSDPVFALLGNNAAAAGAGDVTDLDCLQQRVADQAFTNAKAAGDVAGQADALIFRSMERNTGGVGTASVLCTSETATNPEVAALTQHQDPASSDAAATNKQIALDLAVQLNSIGADPMRALESGTFAPGDTTDTTGAGNTCDDENDVVGCIFSQNLLVDDATAEEITAAVAAEGTGTAAVGNGTATNGTDGCAASTSAMAEATVDTDTTTGNSSDTVASTLNATATTGANVNAFTGTVGSAPVPVISSDVERPFSVNGDTFLNKGAATQRACDVQKNACANVANSGGGGSAADCDTQQQACVAANSRRRR